MKLYYNPASPYARKVLVVAHERGLFSRLGLEPAAPLPTRPVAELSAANPLGKVPTLVGADGRALYDSRVIAEYLDCLPGESLLFPRMGVARWEALRLQALGDGILDGALAARYERVLRPPQRMYTEWVDAQLGKIRLALDVLESEAGSWNETLTIGQIAVACALGYLDFRFAEEDWRSGREQLTAFYERLSARPSMQSTAPPST